MSQLPAPSPAPKRSTEGGNGTTVSEVRYPLDEKDPLRPPP